MALSKPISLETLRKNIIVVDDVWRGRDGVFDVEYRYKRTYQFTNGKLYEKVEDYERLWPRGERPPKWISRGKPSKYAVKKSRWDDTLAYINRVITNPTRKGYFDEYPQKGTYTTVVTKSPNTESLVERKTRKTPAKKKAGMSLSRRASLKSMLTAIKRRK